MARVFKSNPTHITVTAKPAPVWTIPGLFAFDAAVGNAALLQSLLPAGVIPGGTFSVSADGSPLPAGLTLSQFGTISVDASAPNGEVDGVIFEYSEPA